MKRIIVALLVVLVILAGAMPVSADKPVTVFNDDVEATWEIFDCRSLGAEYGYDFTIMRNDKAHVTYTEYYDKDGLIVRIFDKDRGTMEWYSDANPEYRLVSKFDIGLHYDVVTYDPLLWHLRYTGVYYNVNIPGLGPVIRFSGQNEQVFGELVPPTELKSVGNQVWDFASLCSVLAQ